MAGTIYAAAAKKTRGGTFKVRKKTAKDEPARVVR